MAEGYHSYFGLVHVNCKTQKRIIKDSGQWYAATYNLQPLLSWRYNQQ